MNATRFATIDGVTLHYRLEGRARAPLLVLINALGSDLRIWDDLIVHLAHRYSILRYDKRGHGLSDTPVGPYSMRDHAEDLAGLLAHVEGAEPVLIGVSVGGMIATQFALDRPGAVRALVLCDTAARLGDERYWNERMAGIAKRGLHVAADAILSRWFAPGFAQARPADYRGFRNLLARMPVDGYVATCAALRDTDLRGSVDRIQAPTLVLCGSEDPATPPQQVRAFAESIPGASFALIEGAGHMPSVEQPAAMAQKISSFLAALEGLHTE